MSDEPWLLGYVEECEDASALKRHRFPSKVGGAPAWLNPSRLPTERQLTCSATQQQMQFLLQINACPSEGAPDDHPGAFHRSLLVFLSPDGSKLHKTGAVKAFRCQLPRVNEFYASEASVDENPPEVECTDPALAPCDPWSQKVPPATFKDLEIIVEAAEEEEAMVKDDDAGAAGAAGGPAAEVVQSKLTEYEKRVATEGELGESDVAELESMLPAADKDENQWRKFQEVTNANPGSILRYASGTGKEPLWGRQTPVPASIPLCPRCGADRRFEFQVLPQLLAFLDIDDESPAAPDWLTIAVYTCSASCVPQAGTCQEDESPAYAEEFVFVQPPFQT